MAESAYLIQIQNGDTDEVAQIIAMNQNTLLQVIKHVVKLGHCVVNVQSMGNAYTAEDFLEVSDPDDLNFGIVKEGEE